MIAVSLARRALVGLVCVVSLGCSDGGGSVDMATGGANVGGAGASGVSTGGAAAGTMTSGGGTATGGAGAGGVSTAGAGMGGASAGAGMGGMAVDPNGGAPAGPAKGRHTQRQSGTMPGTTAGYWEYLPPHYGNGALYPLLVFRHGVGENGNGTTDLKNVAVHGPPKLIEAN